MILFYVPDKGAYPLMHTKKVLIPFLLLLALVPLCACTATVPTHSVPLPQLVIGSDNYPPYNYTDENGLPGRRGCRTGPGGLPPHWLRARLSAH